MDTHSSFTSEILSLSVGGGVNMDFRYVTGPITPSTTGSGEVSKDKPPHYVVYLPPRSLCVMAGPARWVLVSCGIVTCTGLLEMDVF